MTAKKSIGHSEDPKPLSAPLACAALVKPLIMGNSTVSMADTQRKFTVRRSAPGKGLGLFATETIREGEFVVEYVGEIITNEEADKRRTRYLFEIDEEHAIDGAMRENVARYMNHACKPNVEAEFEGGQIKFYALRTIQAGEELGYDYGEEYFDEFIKPYGCKCSSCSEVSS